MLVLAWGVGVRGAEGVRRPKIWPIRVLVLTWWGAEGVRRLWMGAGDLKWWGGGGAVSRI